MRYQTFTDSQPSTFPICFLAPKLEKDGMVREYFGESGLKPEEVVAYQLHITGKKTSVADQKEFLDELLPALTTIGTEYLMVTDGDYFKTLTGVKKAQAYAGYVLPNKYPESLQGRFNVIFIPNYRQVFYNPEPTRLKIQDAFKALWDHRIGQYQEPGHAILKHAAYPTSTVDIAAWLAKLLDMQCDLTCDIEAFSLKHYSAGIGTISFAWNQHEGIAFPVDLGSSPETVREMLRTFFHEMKHKLIFHNISYDAYVLIYQLFMSDLLDTEGLLDGMDVMLKNWEDTKLITYLATNSCAGNSLGLKDQSQEFTGNYAVEEIKDIRSIPMAELLEYNLIDACATWYVYHKHYDTMVADEQLHIYETLFKPAILDIIQMQLTGMPLDMDKVKETKLLLEVDRDDSLKRIHGHAPVREFVHKLNEEAETERYQGWLDRKAAGTKVRPYTSGNFDKDFNPNSPDQVQRLLYEELGLPVIERTKSKQPATGAEILEKLKAFTEEPAIKAFLDAVLDFKAVDKIYGTFIPAMEEAIKASDGAYYLFGNFNLGGTVSGRLSSSGPNLQTIPATGSKYAKLIKDCFRAPKGYLMIGLDFASLEDRISALTTKDPNKLKVYTDGYDGHSMRAFSYFREQMPDIEDTVESINSIAGKYKPLRQASKTPTFALTYQGTYITLMAKCGFSEEEARSIEARYHELYRVSDEWVDEQLEEASHTGYITAAFGLRVRTPLLHQVIRGTSKTPYEAAAEGRTAGNALGQSWCLLNSRASTEFMGKVRRSPYRLLIRPIAHIHDAQYFLIPDDIDVVQYVNEHLVKAVQWQEHPAIAHDQVKLGGELSIFWPSWAYEKEIPNHASNDTIFDCISEHLDDLNKTGKKAA